MTDHTSHTLLSDRSEIVVMTGAQIDDYFAESDDPRPPDVVGLLATGPRKFPESVTHFQVAYLTVEDVVALQVMLDAVVAEESPEAQLRSLAWRIHGVADAVRE